MTDLPTPEAPKLPKALQPSILAGLPEYLKDPNVYDKVQKAIVSSIQSSCTHSDPSEWMSCRKCGEKMAERRALLKRLGFKSPAQYMQWKKVHEMMRTELRDPLIKKS